MLIPIRAWRRRPSEASSSSFKASSPCEHLLGGADRPQGVVLVACRHPKDGHHLVADELLDRAAVPLDDLAHPVEVAGLHPPVGLGIPFGELGRVDEVAEEDRHGLPLLAPGQRLRER